MRLKSLWYVLGIGMIAWGAKGLLDNTSTKALIHALRLVVVDVIGHDGLFAPVAFVTALLTQRLLPPMVRTPVRVGLAISGVLVLLAMPLILSDRRLRTPSVLPLPYGRNLAILLAIVLAGVLVSVVVTALRSRAAEPSQMPVRRPGA
jgi:hypothetical protein